MKSSSVFAWTLDPGRYFEVFGTFYPSQCAYAAASLARARSS
jgi:hypothetical protein